MPLTADTLRVGLTVSGFDAVSVSSGSVYGLFLPDTFAVLQSLQGRSAFADLALAGAFIIVVIDPFQHRTYPENPDT